MPRKRKSSMSQCKKGLAKKKRVYDRDEFIAKQVEEIHVEHVDDIPLHVPEHGYCVGTACADSAADHCESTVNQEDEVGPAPDADAYYITMPGRCELSTIEVAQATSAAILTECVTMWDEMDVLVSEVSSDTSSGCHSQHDDGNTHCVSEVDTLTEPAAEGNQTSEVYVPVNADPYRLLADEIETNFSENYIVRTASDKIKILELYNSDTTPSVKLSIDINTDYTCDIYVHRKKISATSDFWLTLPSKFKCLSDVQKLISRLEIFSVCTGNCDPEYTSLTPVGSGLSDNKEPSIVAFHEGDFNASVGDHAYHSTIRSVKCDFLVYGTGTRCRNCSAYRRALRQRKQRLELSTASSCKDYTKSSFSHSGMHRSILLKKLKQQKEKINTLEQENAQIRREYDRAITKNGILLQKYENLEIMDLVTTCQKDVENAFPNSNCRQRLFWSQQMKRLNSEASSMRWHPMIVRWCLYLRHKSSKTYEALRDSGFITLPSSRTLFDYSHYIKSELGLQPDVLRMLKEEATKKGLYDSNWRLYVGLLFDEIHIKQDLVYDKHSGELIGYCNLDTVGNEMMELEHVVKGKSESQLAKCMLVVMLRSCACSFTFPICGFATMNITADYLYPIIWKTISAIETQLKLRVLFLTCDGASANRRFFNLHKVDQEDCVFKTINIFDTERNIYFISDVPHLVKTVRNCVSNSHSHRNTSSLWKNGKDISWLHIVRLFEHHCELELYNPCPKLTRSHIDLQSFSYMKVNLAAQVFSDSVATALEELYGDEVVETVILIRHMNKFFDCLNVRSLYEGRNKRNNNLEPYRDVNDARLSYLLTDFLNYFEMWSAEVNGRPGNYTTVNKAGMLLSHQSLTGLKMSVNSICACVKHLLENGADYVLTHTFNQDPLEQHFGHYRHRGGANDNPSVNQVRSIMTTLRTVGAQALPPLQGNIKRQEHDSNFIDHSKLPRRKSNKNTK